MSGLTKQQIAKYKKALESRRTELLDIQESSAESRAPVELDQTTQGRLSRMDALQVQAMALETERRRELELTRIGHALERVNDGEFGYCITCGEDIETKRLDYDPSIATCVACAQ